jgi:opine dehydrogenase
MNKKIAVLGGGHGAHTMAADLTLRGFKVTMYEMPQFKGNIKKLFETGSIKVEGVINGTAKLYKVTDDIDEALADVKYINIAVPGFAHDDYAELLKGKVKKDQVIILYPGNFGALVFKKVLGKECPVICETNTLPYDTRLLGDCHVRVFGFNNTNIAFLPASKGNELIAEVKELFPFQKIYKDVLESGLSSLNPALHTGPCLLNAGPIEYWARGDFYLYEHGFTPSAARVNIKLDNERKEVGKIFGYDLNTMEDFCELKKGFTWQEFYRAVHGNISLTPISGPNSIHNRYLTEDAYCGLVTWASLGRLAGVRTPILDSVINIYNIIHEKDWWEEGRTAEKLGLSGMSIDQMLAYIRE